MVTTTEFDELLDVLRDFIRREVMPAEAGIDSSDEIPAQLIAQAKEMGLYGYALPAEYGGLGLSVEQQVRVTIELGYTSPAFRSLFGTNNGIAGQVLVLAGTEEQRKQWLPRLASGEVVASFALTEPDAGSDPSRLTTSATAGGRRLGHRRPQALHHQRPGGRRLHGVRAHRPAGAARQGHRGVRRAGRAPTGWRSRRETTRWARPAPGPPMSPSPVCGSPATRWSARRLRPATPRRCGAWRTGGWSSRPCAWGSRRGWSTRASAYAKERSQGGHPIGEYQLVQAMLADSQTEYLAARALVLDAAARYDAGTDRRLAPSAAKYFASEAVGRIADRAVQIHGGSGYIRGVPVERLYRDVRLFRIYEGTSQIQQLVIAREMLR